MHCSISTKKSKPAHPETGHAGKPTLVVYKLIKKAVERATAFPLLVISLATDGRYLDASGSNYRIVTYFVKQNIDAVFSKN